MNNTKKEECLTNKVTSSSNSNYYKSIIPQNRTLRQIKLVNISITKRKASKLAWLFNDCNHAREDR